MSDSEAPAQLAFNDDTATQLEVMYRAADVLRRRRLVREALAARPGERILDVGCGPGFYVAELVEAVAPDGSIVGVDRSPQMLAVAQRRVAGAPKAELREGDATALPVDDADVDAALSVQVLEYVEDVPRALGELRRVLRPGGRVVLWDVDWATVSWHSADPARMQRVLAAWDEHLAQRSLPRTLGPALRDAGFAEVGVEGHAFVNTVVDSDSYGALLITLIAQFVSGRAGITPEDAQAWAAEQRSLGEQGRFFFACTQFCVTASRA